MKCQILFSGKNKKNIINLLSAENAQRMVKVNVLERTDHKMHWYKNGKKKRNKNSIRENDYVYGFLIPEH